MDLLWFQVISPSIMQIKLQIFSKIYKLGRIPSLMRLFPVVLDFTMVMNLIQSNKSKMMMMIMVYLLELLLEFLLECSFLSGLLQESSFFEGKKDRVIKYRINLH